MTRINAAFTLYPANQLLEIPTQRRVGVGIKTGEAGFGGVHLAGKFLQLQIPPNPDSTRQAKQIEHQELL